MTRPHLLEGQTLPAAPLQRRSQDNRARLKAAALVAFGEKGYEKTSIDEIARRASLATGTVYQHYRSKRQLLLALMDDLLEQLSQLDLKPADAGDPRSVLHDLLTRAFARDLRYLGAYRAWQEAVLADADLNEKQQAIHVWTTARVLAVLQYLQRLPGARVDVDLHSLATVLDRLFWSLLGQASRMPEAELQRSIASVTHLMHHAMFRDPRHEGGATKGK
jgi:AcrR family transcriptional regulator